MHHSKLVLVCPARARELRHCQLVTVMVASAWRPGRLPSVWPAAGGPLPGCPAGLPGLQLAAHFESVCHWQSK